MTPVDKNCCPTKDSEQLTKTLASLLSTKTFLKSKKWTQTKLYFQQ